jgi:hypothetical protein
MIIGLSNRFVTIPTQSTPRVACEYFLRLAILTGQTGVLAAPVVDLRVGAALSKRGNTPV